MSESVIYRPQNKPYMSVTNVHRTARDSATPITACEKFFPCIMHRSPSILYKGLSFSIDFAIPQTNQSQEYVAFFARSSNQTLELVAVWVTKKVDWIVELEPEAA